MQVSVLGALGVTSADGRDVPVPGRLVRRLLLRLAMGAPAAVPVPALLAAVWPDGAAPADAANALQSLVSRLRRALGRPGAVQGGPGGYTLDLPADAVDAHRAGRLASRGRTELAEGRPAAAIATLGLARALFRGEPLVEAADADWARGEVARLEQLALDVAVDLAQARLRAGEPAVAAAELEALVAAHPLREDVTRLLMSALAAVGRGAEALAAYEGLRVRLADHLGADPGPEVQALHLELLRGESPAPRRARSNLRSFLTTFVGRAGESDRLADLLAGHRLVTVVGPGGVGKTRLAVHAAERAAGAADGVWLVELAPVASAEAVPAAVLDLLGSSGGPLTSRFADSRAVNRDPLDRLVDLLADADLLLVLDNCEHLLDACARVADRVLARCPGVRILATSREPLGILGEAVYAVPPLALPPAEVDPADALLSPAVALLVDRASAGSDFRITADNLDPVLTIVRRLDGLPLAIELAAARLRVLPADTVADRLSDRFRLLAGGNRVALPRHRTLRAAVDWSWELLSGPERRLAERLAVFPAGATATAAAAVCGGGPVPVADVPDLLVSLAEKSLVQVVEGPGEPRFRMLETIREYGWDRLAEQGEADTVRLAHARWFADLAESLDPLLRTGEQVRALTTLRAERENLQAALRHLGDAGHPHRTVTLALSLCWFWTMTDAGGEAVPWLDYALAASAGADDPRRLLLEGIRAVQSMAIDDDAWTLRDPADWERWRADLGSVLDRLDAVEAELGALPFYGILRTLLAYFSGASDRGEELVDGLAGADGWTRAAGLALRASFAENVGRLAEMRAAVTTAHALFTGIGDRWGLMGTLENRSHLKTMDGDLPGALADLREALACSIEVGADSESMFLRLRMADLELRLGRPDQAHLHLRAAGLPTRGRPRSSSRELVALGVTAAVLQAEGEREQALALVHDLRVRTRARPGSPAVFGHLAAMLCAVTAHVEVVNGELDLAGEDLRYGYRQAVQTGDGPILAGLGVSVAVFAHAVGEDAEAAVLLGAAARLRGAADHTDLRIAGLTAALRESLGAASAAEYEAGRSLDREAAVARLDPEPLLDPGDRVGAPVVSPTVTG